MVAKKKNSELKRNKDADFIKAMLRNEMKKIYQEQFSKQLLFLMFHKDGYRVKENIECIEKVHDLIMSLLIEEDYHRAMKYVLILRIYIQKLLKMVRSLFEVNVLIDFYNEGGR